MKVPGKTLSQWGLQIATEKVQISDTGQFLGSVVSSAIVLHLLNSCTSQRTSMLVKTDICVVVLVPSIPISPGI